MNRGHSARPELAWFKSSSCPNNATCVEAAALPDGGFALRDGKNPDEPHLVFNATGWAQFLAGVRAGEFDPARR
jgi:Domain of unknown function (DUF397)